MDKRTFSSLVDDLRPAFATAMPGAVYPELQEDWGLWVYHPESKSDRVGIGTYSWFWRGAYGPSFTTVTEKGRLSTWPGWPFDRPGVTTKQSGVHWRSFATYDEAADALIGLYNALSLPT